VIHDGRLEVLDIQGLHEMMIKACGFRLGTILFRAITAHRDQHYLA
jgi:hypothetical protein